MGHKCPISVREPSHGLWTGNETVAWRTSNGNSADTQKCCGVTNDIHLYKKDCFKFCNLNGNATEVLSCMEDAGIKSARSFHHDSTSAGISFKTQPLSKPALGLIFLVAASFLAGTV